MSLCDKLWEKKKTSWFWGLIWRIFGCRTPVVQVLTCLGTHKIANDWCPDTELRSYNVGTEPTEVCDQHKEPEPPEPPEPPPPPPPVKHKLDPKKVYQVDVDKKFVKGSCPCLIPTIGFNKIITEKDAEGFADRFAEEGWGNHIRFFVDGSWEPLWQDEDKIWLPYIKKGGKFHVTKRNPKHYDCLWRRANYFAERDVRPTFSLLDNCSIHVHRPGYWNTHWMNGNNNINGTSDEAYSQTHWYEYNHPPDERPGMKETGEILMEKYGYILDEAKKHFGRFFLIEIGNEIDARSTYHSMLRKFINERLGQGDLDRRVFTSMRHAHFYESRIVNANCIPVIHGCGNYEEYDEGKKVMLGMRHGASQDGKFPLTTTLNTRINVLKILRSDAVLYEGNLRPIFEWKDGKWVNVGGNEDWTLKSMRYELFKAYGDAFSEYLA